jgi:2-dehydro-3-deoxygluconokinase
MRVASIGECMIELRHRGGSEDALELAYGGDTLNFAVYFARLTRGQDIAVDYVTALGDDAYSSAMLDTWCAEGIGCDLVARLPDRLPGLYTIRTDSRGERSFTYWRSASAARDLLSGGQGTRIVEQLVRYDLLYLSGVTLSILDPAQRETLMDLAVRLRARGGRVAFDSNFRPAGWPDRAEAQDAFDRMLQRVDIALPTLDDDQALFGVADAAECAQRLHGLGVAEVVIKLGERGCCLSAGGPALSLPAVQVARVLDSTAAGDSFNAGYLAARLAGIAPDEAARQGNRLAARVIGQAGAVIPVAAMTDLMPEAS